MSSPEASSFSDCPQDTVSLPSIPEPKPPTASAATETTDVVFKERGVQRPESGADVLDKTVQADPVEQLQQHIHSLQGKSGAPAKPQVDEASLTAFLRRITPHVLAELDGVDRTSPAFAAYQPHWEETNQDITCIHELRKPDPPPSPTQPPAASASSKANSREKHEKQRAHMPMPLVEDEYGSSSMEVEACVTGVSWNAKGSTIAVSYGQPGMVGWCERAARVCLWSLYRSGERSNVPDVTLDVASFGTCVSFHPTEPAILACGTYNGEVAVWDLTKGDGQPDGMVLAKSPIDDFCHKEAVRDLAWVPDTTQRLEGGYWLMSVSGEGRVLLWSLESSDKLAYPLRTYAIRPPKRQIFGGVRMAFSPIDPSLFAIGSEVGAIARGFLRLPPKPTAKTDKRGGGGGAVVWRISALQLMDNLNQANRAVVEAHVEKYCQSQGVKEVTAEVVFRSSPPEDKWLEVPKVAELECHAGPVTALQFSPFFRKILLSASTDGSVKVFDVLQARPIHVFCPPVPSLSQSALSGACWAPCRRLVFAVAAQRGGAWVYDLMQTTHQPVVSLPLGTNPGGVGSIQYNRASRSGQSAIAVGESSSSGRVWVVRLPHKLSQPEGGREEERAASTIFRQTEASN